MKHYLYSHDLHTDVDVFEEFDTELIRTAIIKHLTEHPNDILEQEIDYVGAEKIKYYGRKCIDLFEVNPKNNKISKVITKGNKVFYKSLID